jgi:DNA-binding MarR family transcriptional regulator
MTAGHNIAIALRSAYLALHRWTEARFASHGVTADQFVLLAMLDRGQALTQRELARRMASDPSTVRAMLVLLAKRGFVRRDSNPTDARARTVALTPLGKRTFRQLWAAGEPIREQMLAVLGPEEAKTLVQLLGRVTESLNAKHATAGASTSLHSPEDDP